MKVNKRPAPLIAAVMAFGVIGGVIRYCHLKTGFDELGLNKEHNAFAVVLIGLVAVVAVLLIVTAVYAKRGRSDRTDKLSLGTVGWKSNICISVASVLIIAGTAVKFAISLRPFSIWGILIGILMFCSGMLSVSVLRKLPAKQDGRNMKGTVSLLPVFMACFALIEYYRDISRNPVPSLYIYNVLAYVSLILMVFSFAGYIFSRGSLFRVFMMLLAYMFFGTLTLVGQLIYLADDIVKNRPPLSDLLNGDVVELFVLGYGFFFAAAVFILFFRPKRVALEESISE